MSTNYSVSSIEDYLVVVAPDNQRPVLLSMETAIIRAANNHAYREHAARWAYFPRPTLAFFHGRYC